MVYSRAVQGKTLTFGVSGRLYKSNMLFYDHQSESLWSQMREQAVTGPMAGNRLVKLPAVRVSWKQWLADNPNTLVLSTETGYQRDYERDPYAGYFRAAGIWFPVGDVRTDLAAKDRVIGIAYQGKSKAYPLKTLHRMAGIVEDVIGDETIRIRLSGTGEVTDISTNKGVPIPHTFSYWFVWQAFYPRTEVFRSK